MSYRVLIFDDEQEIRHLLWLFFDKRGYEVFTFPNPGACPLSEEKRCPCSTGKACADIVLSDLSMPVKNGLDFLEEQFLKGCRCKYFALMSGNFADDDIARAKQLGIKIFKKPFRLEDVMHWLDQIEKDIDPERKLSDWFLKKISTDSDK